MPPQSGSSRRGRHARRWKRSTRPGWRTRSRSSQRRRRRSGAPRSARRAWRAPWPAARALRCGTTMTLVPSFRWRCRAPTHASVSIASKVRPYSAAADCVRERGRSFQTVSQPRRSAVSAAGLNRLRARPGSRIPQGQSELHSRLDATPTDKYAAGHRPPLLPLETYSDPVNEISVRRVSLRARLLTRGPPMTRVLHGARRSDR